MQENAIDCQFFNNIVHEHQVRIGQEGNGTRLSVHSKE